MVSNIINRLNVALQKVDRFVELIFRGGFPPQALSAMEVNCDKWNNFTYKGGSFSLKDIWGEGIFWGVPKHRRTIEKRWRRKFGHPDYHLKLLKPRTNLITCHSCGHAHEAGILCAHCYGRIKEETTKMQEAIVQNLGLDPVEKEVIVLYEGEKVDKTKEFWKNQRIVELPQKRPEWFHKNLLQPTTQEPSDSTEVKPTNLA
ncbi:39S ribosomal protein L32, mitochondrial [Belonocnema kinseyi]|uniref:39S ribosomal protein L32, mitochondrial n=1 Tax=Belonocnema kinseyi TaxID=2817044 RepID=UPI00143DC486|nr:39S ribosomal protein L32, mitochondrial [Belonocnema kinseyi]